MNFLLTGGAGYIGSHAALSLLDAGHNVHIIDDLSTGNESLIPKNAFFTNCNISDEKVISELIKSNSFDLLMHFAGFIQVEESVKYPQKYFDNNTENATTFAYHYEVDLNTSFTGDDKLNVEIATGNSSGTNTTQGITGFGESQPGDMLAVEDVNYTFPLGRWDVSIGDSMDLSKNFPNACQLGTIVDAMDDCGAKNAVDAGGDVSASFGTEFGDGWEFGFGFTGDSGTKGIGTKQSTDGYGLALGYSNDTYGVTFGYALKETSETAETTYVGATAYYSPENLGTFSGGYELGDKSGTDDDTTQYKVGYATDLGEGTLEVGFGTNGAIADNVDEEFAYEASYSFPINDGVSMTAFGYIAEVADKDDTTGIGLTTTFKF